MNTQQRNFVIKGNLCYSTDKNTISCHPNSYAVCLDGVSAGVFDTLPERYASLPLYDFGDHVIIPGLTDLHTHAPQFGNRGMAMDLELLDWLNAYTFKEESKFADIDYAKRAYGMFVEELRHSATTRACIFATLHVPATIALMDALEQSGLHTYVGKVNMDRNSPDTLIETTEQSFADTLTWLNQIDGKYTHTKPILTPRFVPSCTDELMQKLGELANARQLPVQSHLSENQSEMNWVQELCPWSKTYGHAYDEWGLFGNTPTIMAHCVWCPEEELALMKQRGIMIAHSPASNVNLSSGIAPIKRYLEEGCRVGLASDCSAGQSASILKAMSDAIAVSKMHWVYVDKQYAPLTLEEAFYLGTLGGGSFFGKVGSLDTDYAFDAVVIDDTALTHPQELTLHQRLERIVHMSERCRIVKKYVAGTEITL